jgi:probable F420-dependent oxidoreductase
VWSPALRYGDPSEAGDAAAELEALGYTAVWIPDVGGELFGPLERLLAATDRVIVATGILNLWMHEPAEAARRHHELTAVHGRRFLMGIGVSHQLLIDLEEAGRYRRPLARMVEFLDGLDAADHPVDAEDRVLAALGPRMLELARDRAAGCHQYLVTPDHTAAARGALGPGKLVAPEQGVVLETDPAEARRVARQHLAAYAVLPNYVNNWKRLGFTDEDVADGCSDRLVDALVAWGDEEAIAGRVAEHRAAGADHVCVQVLAEDPRSITLDGWRRLAPALCS